MYAGLNIDAFVTEKRTKEFVTLCADKFFDGRMSERNPHVSFDAFMQGVEFGKNFNKSNNGDSL